VKYFAFLRAVNVVGRNVVRMDDLKTLCTDLGYRDVRTLLNSGNVVFNAKRATPKQIEEAIRKHSKLDIKVMLRTEDELRDVVARNPFATIRNPSHLLVFVLDREPAAGAVTALREKYQGPEVFHAAGRELYVDYVEGVGRSKLTSNLIERTLGVAGTGRNWNTVTRLLTFSGS